MELEKKGYSEITITPVSIEQIKNEFVKNDNVITLYNKEINKIIVVGKLSLKEKQNNRVFLEINDGTGFLEITCIKKFEESEPLLLRGIQLEKNPYVKVVLDHYRPSSDSEIKFTGIYFEELTDLNGITFHLLEIMAFKKKIVSTGGISEFNREKQVFVKKDEENTPKKKDSFLNDDGELNHRVLNFIKNKKIENQVVSFKIIKNYFKQNDEELNEIIEDLKAKGN